MTPVLVVLLSLAVLVHAQDTCTNTATAVSVSIGIWSSPQCDGEPLETVNVPTNYGRTCFCFDSSTGKHSVSSVSCNGAGGGNITVTLHAGFTCAATASPRSVVVDGSCRMVPLGYSSYAKVTDPCGCNTDTSSCPVGVPSYTGQSASIKGEYNGLTSFELMLIIGFTGSVVLLLIVIAAFVPLFIAENKFQAAFLKKHRALMESSTDGDNGRYGSSSYSDSYSYNQYHGYSYSSRRSASTYSYGNGSSDHDRGSDYDEYKEGGYYDHSY